MNATNESGIYSNIVCLPLDYITIIKLFVGLMFTLPGGLINSFFIVVIYQNRRKHWAKQLQHVKCLIASDSILGFMNTFLAMNRFLPICIRPKFVCVISEYVFISSQLISLNQILVVCVDRFMKIIRVARSDNTRYVRPYLTCILIWTGTLFLCALPYVIWKDKMDADDCVSNNGILHNTPSSSMPYFAVLLSVPCFATNTLYFVICCMLFLKLNRRVTPHSGGTYPQPRCSYKSDSSRNENNVSKGSTNTRESIFIVQSSSKLSQTDENNKCRQDIKIETIIDGDNSQSGGKGIYHTSFVPGGSSYAVRSTNQDLFNGEHGEEMQIYANSKTNAIKQSRSIKKAGQIRTRERMSRQVVTTVGVLLLIHDVITWPLVCYFIGRLVNPDFQINATFYLLLFLNQIINPFIYTIRIKQLREAQAKFVKDMCSCRIFTRSHR